MKPSNIHQTTRSRLRKVDPDEMSLHDIAVLFFASAFIIKNGVDDASVILDKAVDMADHYMITRENNKNLP